MNIKKFSLLILFVLTVGLLSACSTPKEDPEQVVSKFKAAMTEVQSGDLTVDLAMQGADAQDNLDFKGKVDLKFDRENEKERKADINLLLSGSMKTAERSLSGNADLNFRTLGNQFYLQLKKLQADDPSMQTIQPIVKYYEGKWLKLPEDLIPENVKQLQEKDEATLAKEEEYKKIFRESSLFSVTKEYGVESVNGEKAYHYGITWSEAGVRDYLQKSAVLNGQPMQETNLNDALKLLATVSNTEFWVGTEDYYLYKGILTLNPANDAGVKTQVELTLNANSYNEGANIETPKDATDFNPMELLQFGQMGAAANEAPAPSAPKE
ncbi:MAG: hypothetical protein V1908_04305 [Candidatus Peregrinibacteria bacterium]